MWLFDWPRSFLEISQIFVVCTQTHHSNRTTTRTLSLLSLSWKPMFFHKKRKKSHKISRVLQKFDAFCDIFIGVFVSDLKDEIAWWSVGKPHEILW